METPPLKMKAKAPSKRRDNSPTLVGDIPEDALDTSTLPWDFNNFIRFNVDIET